MDKPKELLLLEEWQKRLGLHDCAITLEDKCSQSQMIDENTDGDVEYVESTKCAIIRIVDPETTTGTRMRVFNWEEILVHELLHCKLAVLATSDNWEEDLQPRILHQIVDDLARAFVDAKYKEKQ